MRSIQRRFLAQETKHPFASSYIHFAEAIKGQRFSKPMICRWFNKLVDKDDYSRSEKRAVISHLENPSNPPRTTGIEGKLIQGEDKT